MSEGVAADGGTGAAGVGTIATTTDSGKVTRNVDASVRVSGLDKRMSAPNCRKLLAKYGAVVDLEHTGASSSEGGAGATCTAQFASSAEAEKCCVELDGKLVLGKAAVVIPYREFMVQRASGSSSRNGVEPRDVLPRSSAAQVAATTSAAAVAAGDAAAATPAAARGSGGGGGGGRNSSSTAEANKRVGKRAAGFDLDRPLAAITDDFLTSGPSATQFDRVKNAKMFRGSADGTKRGVWNGFGVTYTPQCPTLIVANVPGRGQSADAVIRLFEAEEGFQTSRCIKHLVFVDFESVATATRAMIKHQNAMLPGHREGQGLAVDYDKDTRSKRNREYEKSVQGEKYQSRNFEKGGKHRR